VRDASGNVVELKTLQPDGTYADPDELAATTGDALRSRTRRRSSPTATDVDPSSSVEVAGGGDFVQEPAEDQPRDDA
jgi:hypothetical protein